MSRLYDAATRLLADPARYFGHVAFAPEGSKLYVTDPAMNLLPGIALDDIRADLDNGAGNELASKFRAPHSSSALMINTLAPFRKAGVKVTIGRHADLDRIVFEKKCPHGLPSDHSPNLDAVAENADVLVIESKFLEYLKPKAAKFAPMYVDAMPAVRRGRVYQHMLDLIAQPRTYRRLDAAQLIKHIYGLTHTYAGRPITLLYLFWEPENAADQAVFAEHRAEIADFGQRIADDGVTFEAMSYPELWRSWDRFGGPQWLGGHLASLRKRYAMTIPV